MRFIPSNERVRYLVRELTRLEHEGKEDTEDYEKIFDLLSEEVDDEPDASRN